MTHIKQLKSIQDASGWSQEQLAAQLRVSFVTLNSWINNRSLPRAKALLAIEKLYHSILGVEMIDESELRRMKQAILRLHITPKEIIDDENKLEKLALYLTYHTNAIEGSTMTLSEVQQVIFEDKVLPNRTAVEQIEARNHKATLYWLLDEMVSQGDNFVIDEMIILNIHLRLMNGILSDAGKYRRHHVRIAGSQVLLANWAWAPGLIKELTDDLQDTSNGLIETLANTHARFEQIHPFSDGNGRTGRLIMLAQALRVGLMPPLILKEKRFAYYKYLEAAQSRGDYAPLELLIAESIKTTKELISKLTIDDPKEIDYQFYSSTAFDDLEE